MANNDSIPGMHSCFFEPFVAFCAPANLDYRTTPGGTLLTGLHAVWDAGGRMAVRERKHDATASVQRGEVFRYDRMDRLTTMWYDVEDPNAFASTDPVEGTDPYDHRETWNLGRVYERTSTVTKPYQQTAATTPYTVNASYQYTAVGGTTMGTIGGNAGRVRSAHEKLKECILK